MARILTFLFLLSILLLGACQATIPTSPPPTQPNPSPSIIATASPQATATTEGVTSPIPPSCPAIEGDVLNQMRRVERDVSQLRGLPALLPVERRLFTIEQLTTYVQEDYLAGYTAEEARAEAAFLFLLGLLPADTDLRQLYVDLFSEQVAGFYDIAANEMVVVCKDGFNALERLTYAHEFVHTLQDQHFDLEDGLAYSESACEHSSQRCLATRAFFEGDAALLQEQWLRRVSTAQDIEDLALFFSTFTMPVYDSAPAYIQAEFTFPYLEGSFFVRSLFLKDGWEGVDAVYSNPPQSTEHILHPERYPWDEAVLLEPPELTALSEQGWEVVYEDVLGEWTLRKMLEVYLPMSISSKAAEGWGGDFILLLRNPATDEQALFVLVQWDSMRDAHEFTDAYKKYGDLRFGEALSSKATGAEWAHGELYVMLERLSNQTLLILSTSENLPSIRDSISLPIRALP